MSTPWSNQLVSLVLITAPSGAYAGIFVYSPSPGPGNLIGSWAAQAGIDPFGNHYPQGLNVAVGTISGGTISGVTITGSTISGTTFTGTNFIINTSGAFFYSSAPALGNLIASIAGSSGVDGFGNVYSAGVGIEKNGLVLFNQSGVPAGITNAGVLYMNATGQLRFINNFNTDLVLDRSITDPTNFTMNTQTIPQRMSSNLTYVGGEAIVGSEYEVEINGTCTTPATTTAAFSFDFFIDGAQFIAGTNLAASGVIMQTGLTYAYTVRYRCLVITTGISGTATISMDGSMTRKGVQAGGIANQFVTLNNVVVNAPIDTTINHNIAIYCNWGSTTGTGHSAITYQTKKTRRN